MARRTQEEHTIRKIQMTRATFSVSLPVEYMRELGWRRGQKIVVKRVSRGVLITDWRK